MNTSPSDKSLSTAELLKKLISLPLYTPLPLVGEEDGRLQVSKLRLFEGKFDQYCPECKKHSTWAAVVPHALKSDARLSAAVVPTRGHPIQYNWLTPFNLRIACTRASHVGNFHIELSGGRGTPVVLLKSGQYPSLRDFQLGDLGEFKEAMTDEHRREFVQAVTTAAHGFSVAACVYYRRVFEGLLILARDEHMAENNMTDWPDFTTAKTDQRIKLLSTRLPKFLSEHPQIYGILSKGVHELTEEQCAAELSFLRLAMELILGDRVVAIRQAKQRVDVSRLVAQVGNRVK